jgi:Spy/CpxP family protein refolding chaperone
VKGKFAHEQTEITPHKTSYRGIPERHQPNVFIARSSSQYTTKAKVADCETAHYPSSEERSKRMKVNKVLIIILAATMVFGAASTILAKGGRGPHGMDMGKLIEDLDLSEEQKEQVEAIVEKYENDKDNLVEGMKEAREELHDAIFAEEYNESTVRQAAQQVSSIMEGLAVLRAKMIAELRTVLSSEQIGYLQGRMEAKKDHRRYRRGREGR